MARLRKPRGLHLLLIAIEVALAQILPSTFPHNYTGIPSGGYGPEWQQYFQVTDKLPNVTQPVARSFAGNVGVNRAGHPNNTLWFWGFEKEQGSLTAQAGEREDEPWLIWLNGGPGSSSQLGMMTENGPLRVQDNYSITQNNFSWHKLADAFWVDQPVGVGYSTADARGYVFDEDQMGEDFVGFLANLVKVFPSLATRPFHLTGESYAGVYIPYIVKHIFAKENPPVKLRKFAIGDGSIGSFTNTEEVSTVTTLETFPQIINYDPDVFQYFREQSHLCGFDLNLTYPQNGHFPSLVNAFTTGNPDLALRVEQFQRSKSSLNLRLKAMAELHKRGIEREVDVQQEKARMEWKRDLTNRPNGTLDPFYGCFLWEEMTDYAVNFTFPWTNGDFDPYDIPDALNPEVPRDPSVFLNDNTTRTALHAPIKEWDAHFRFPFGNSTRTTPAGNPFGDLSVEPMAFMTDLATNASEQGVGIVIYSGNSDSLVAHFSSEVVIQNMTFGGIQGFTRRPSTPLLDDHGHFAGIVHQERNVTYVLFKDAGHFVPRSQPEAAFVFLREFILGSNTTGLVKNDSSVVGGEDSSLTGPFMPADTNAIFFGSGSTSGSTLAPPETVSAWISFLATATAQLPPVSLSTSSPSNTNAASGTSNGAYLTGGAIPSRLLTAFTLAIMCIYDA